VHWSGKYRAPLDGVTVTPQPVQQPHPPLWIGGGSSFDSVDLAARLGLPLMLPSVLGPPAAFVPLVERYRERFEAGPAGARPVVGCCSHVHVGEDGTAARERWRPYHMGYVGWVYGLINEGGANIGNPRPGAFDPAGLDYERLLAGPSICGSPAEVVDRICSLRELFGLDVHLAMFDHGGLPEGTVFEVLDLFGERVLRQTTG
jgi:alkanesulfonate monooxygenase SsuD/methylene tetrahydromethanopterin reductase-like flavin-dependent oxidoreductase (luciferase family)